MLHGTTAKTRELTREERRARRLLRREKQRKDNIRHAAKMHAARLKWERPGGEHHAAQLLKAPAYVGCSGWFYWKWRGTFYPEDLPTGEWFRHYAKRLSSVEINASFYSWPTVANVNAWRRQAARKRNFVYTVKACELITHIKKFKGTKTLIKVYWDMADSEIEKLLRGSPVVMCPGCELEMVLLRLEPSGDTGFKTGVYYCVKCGTETQREFRPNP